MQKPFMILTAAAMMAGSGFAQNKAESVESILKELSAYDGAPAPAAAPEAAPAAATVATGSEAAEAAPAIAPADVDAMLAESSAQLAGGEFAKAQQGFEAIVKIAPENLTARMYLRTLMERDQRSAEIKGMKAVDAAWSTALVFRSYALGSDAGEKMGLVNVKDAMDVKNLFPQVDFPKGSSAIYQPKMSALFVRNTRENLAVIEALLGAMDLAKLSSEVSQVEIEAKFIEVSEGTLEALGFQWNLKGSADLGGGSDLEVADGAGGLFANALRGSPTGGSPNLPFDKTVNLGSGQASASGDWSSFGLVNTFNNQASDITLENRGKNPVDVMISALDQSTGTDVLSAPRIVTRSGEEATIRVGEIHNYPEVYEGDTSEATILNVSYQDFTEKLLGVELVVNPEVDGDQITLSLNPRITELAGWQRYELAPASSIYNHRQSTRVTGMYNTAAPITASLPIFKKREIKTEVTIADGSTIGMGGLINEKIEKYEDKVPLLGSLPLVGRLFRHEGERAVKRNLLMFVTAKKVEPSGRINTARSFE